jgi:hypothetical protein
MTFCARMYHISMKKTSVISKVIMYTEIGMAIEIYTKDEMFPKILSYGSDKRLT